MQLCFVAGDVGIARSSVAAGKLDDITREYTLPDDSVVRLCAERFEVG